MSPRTGLALRQWTPQQLVRVAVAHKPYFPPGKGWHYSNTNFLLLGLIVEQVTGQPVAAVLQTRILRPLGLGDLLTGVPAIRAVRAAVPEHHLVLATTAALEPLAALVDAVDEVLPARELEPLDSAGPPPELAVDLHGNLSLELLDPATRSVLGSGDTSAAAGGVATASEKSASDT